MNRFFSEKPELFQTKFQLGIEQIRWVESSSTLHSPRNPELG